MLSFMGVVELPAILKSHKNVFTSRTNINLHCPTNKLNIKISVRHEVVPYHPRCQPNYLILYLNML